MNIPPIKIQAVRRPSKMDTHIVVTIPDEAFMMLGYDRHDEDWAEMLERVLQKSKEQETA